MSLAHAILAAPSERYSGGPSSKLPELLGMPERELVERLRAGDEAAFNALYRTFFPRLVAVASGYVPRETGKELAQDVFVAVWERRATWPADMEVGVYLYAAVRNRAISRLRHERVVGRVAQAAVETGETPGMGTPAVATDVTVERAELHVAVEDALAQLPEGMRTAFTLRWIHELSYAEVARIMGVSEAAARKQVSRARDAIVPVLRRFAEG